MADLLTKRIQERHRGAIAWMANNSVAANLFMILFLLGGLIMSCRVRQEVFPETTLDIVSVEIPYPGASPEEVEKGILLSVEEAVRGIDGVKRVTSVATEGMGVVSIELMIDADDNKVLADIKSNVDRITSLPKDSERAIVRLLTNRSEVISVVIYGDQDAHVLRALADRVRDQLLSDPGITQADLVGVPAKEIVIEVAQAELRSYGLTLEGIAQRVAQTALELPGGGVKTPSGEVLVRTQERRNRDLEFENIPITNAGGTEVRLGDMGEVREDFAETDQSATFEGQPAVMVKVYRVGEQTPIDISERVHEQMELMREWMPPGVSLAAWSDWSEIYRDRMSLLLRNALQGLVLVLLSLGLFLEIRLAFWVTMGIPISFLGSFILLPALDTSINMISMFAFIVTLGMVVDDAIVVGESIFNRRQKDESLLSIAIAGTKEVATPVAFSIATTVVAFMPLFFVPGFMGKLFKVIPTIVISVLLISLFESIFILPAHLGHLRKAKETGIYGAIHRRQQWFRRGLESFIHRYYRPVLALTLRNRYLALAIGFGILIMTCGLVPGGRLGFTFFPKIDGDVAFASIELPYGASVERTREIQEHVLRACQETIDEFGGDAIKRGLYAQIGSLPNGGGPRGGGAGTVSGGHQASIQVFFVPSDGREFTSSEFIERWRERVGDIPEARSLQFWANMGPNAGKPIDIEFRHPDESQADRIAAELIAELKTYAGVYDVEYGRVQGKPQLDLSLTPEAVSLGLTSRDIAQQVRSAFYGAEAFRQQEGRDEIRVLVRLQVQERRSEANIENLLIRTPQGGETPLVEVVNIDRDRSLPSIERADGKRIHHVTADINEQVTTAGEILGLLKAEEGLGAQIKQWRTGQKEEKILDRLQRKYPGLEFEFGGENREQREALSALMTGALLALLGVYALLAIPFRSYIQPVLVMLAIPFGFVGAVFGHLLMGFQMSMISMMGMVALAGVVVNDSLVLIDAANQYRNAGQTPLEAVSSAGVRRFRPILLTSLTTFFGLTPMILETSAQARFLVPMAISLGFGVLFATVIALLFVPSAYLVIEDMRHAVMGKKPK